MPNLFADYVLSTDGYSEVLFQDAGPNLTAAITARALPSAWKEVRCRDRVLRYYPAFLPRQLAATFKACDPKSEDAFVTIVDPIAFKVGRGIPGTVYWPGCNPAELMKIVRGVMDANPDEMPPWRFSIHRVEPGVYKIQKRIGLRIRNKELIKTEAVSVKRGRKLQETTMYGFHMLDKDGAFVDIEIDSKRNNFWVHAAFAGWRRPRGLEWNVQTKRLGDNLVRITRIG